jgi:hypothetical protein
VLVCAVCCLCVPSSVAVAFWLCCGGCFRFLGFRFALASVSWVDDILEIFRVVLGF